MDAELARQFRDRWKAVAAVEVEEQKAASVMLRWQQLNAIVRMSIGLGLSVAKSEDKEEIVRMRWERLKGAGA